jgi:adenylylsulfate kinase
MRRILFIGRYQPLHAGHKALIQTALDEGHRAVIAIRDTKIGKDNPYSVEQRIEMIRQAFKCNVSVCTIPDIDEVWVGRDVGYRIIHLEEEIENISGTKIRELLRKKGDLQ